MRKTTIVAFGLFSMFSLCANAQILNEGFESTFPPTGWTVDNPDALITFTAASVGNSGSKSAFVDAFNMAQAEQGQADALITSALNLSGTASPSLTFYYAYQMYSNPAVYTTADALSVYASTDGGTTWTSIYNKTGNTLITATNPCDSVNGFIPTSGEWKMETVDISSVATSASVQFKFEFVNDWENNFYIDDIRLTDGVTAINNPALDSHVNVFPNPSTGPVVVDLAVSGLGHTEVTVYNMLGEEVNRVSCNVTAPEQVKFNLANKPSGIYFVKVASENANTTKKVILNK